MVLGFWSVMRRKGPVFTDEKGKGRQPMVAFDLSGYPRLKRALGYFGFLSAIANSDTVDQTVYGGPEGIGIHPRPVIQYGKREEKAGTPAAPPKREGSTFPGYVLNQEAHAY